MNKGEEAEIRYRSEYHDIYVARKGRRSFIKQEKRQLSKKLRSTTRRDYVVWKARGTLYYH